MNAEVKTMTPAEENEAIIRRIAQERLVSVEVIKGRGKDRFAFLARQEIANILYNKGLSTTQIGRYLNRDHTTILNMLGRLSRSRKTKAE